MGVAWRAVVCLFVCSRVRALGSAALGMCQVATGAADVYFHVGMHCWDIAAAALILQEAGGVVMDTDGVCVCVWTWDGGFRRPSSEPLCVSSGSEFDMMSRRVLAACSSRVANRIAPLIRAFPCQRDDHGP